MVTNGATSGWQPVTGGVPQGSFYGQFCSICISITHMQQWVICNNPHDTTVNFADDTEVGGAVDS